MRFLSQIFHPERLRAERERAYLECSVSMADVERRQREIDAGLFRPQRWTIGK